MQRTLLAYSWYGTRSGLNGARTTPFDEATGWALAPLGAACAWLTAIVCVSGCAKPANLCGTASEMKAKTGPACCSSSSSQGCLSCPPSTVCVNWEGVPATEWSTPSGSCCWQLPLGCDPKNACSCPGLTSEPPSSNVSLWDSHTCYSCYEADAGPGLASIGCDLSTL